MAASARWQLVATGRVQGVNYRARVAEAARLHGIVGFVENRPDGSVFVEAQGDLESLGRFLQSIIGRRGLSDAQDVRRLEELPESVDLRTFSVRR